MVSGCISYFQNRRKNWETRQKSRRIPGYMKDDFSKYAKETLAIIKEIFMDKYEAGKEFTSGNVHRFRLQ
jgi:hypothetical protein